MLTENLKTNIQSFLAVNEKIYFQNKKYSLSRLVNEIRFSLLGESIFWQNHDAVFSLISPFVPSSLQKEWHSVKTSFSKEYILHNPTKAKNNPKPETTIRRAPPFSFTRQKGQKTKVVSSVQPGPTYTELLAPTKLRTKYRLLADKSGLELRFSKGENSVLFCGKHEDIHDPMQTGFLSLTVENGEATITWEMQNPSNLCTSLIPLGYFLEYAHITNVPVVRVAIKENSPSAPSLEKYIPRILTKFGSSTGELTLDMQHYKPTLIDRIIELNSSLEYLQFVTPSIAYTIVATARDLKYYNFPPVNATSYNHFIWAHGDEGSLSMKICEKGVSLLFRGFSEKEPDETVEMDVADGEPLLPALLNLFHEIELNMKLPNLLEPATDNIEEFFSYLHSNDVDSIMEAYLEKGHAIADIEYEAGLLRRDHAYRTYNAVTLPLELTFEQSDMERVPYLYINHFLGQYIVCFQSNDADVEWYESISWDIKICNTQEEALKAAAIFAEDHKEKSVAAYSR